MVISEKIKLYRAKAELSQEALAQMLSVDVETIKLWEEGKVSPDNAQLAKLNEILGMSNDEITNSSYTDKEEIPVAKESYTCKFSDEDLFEVHKITSRSALKKSLLSPFALLVLLILLIISDDIPASLVGFVVGAFITITSLILSGHRINKNNWKVAEKEIAGSVYEYQVYDDYLIANIHKDEETFSRTKILFSQVKLVQDLGRFFTFVYVNKIYIIKKADLKQDSMLYNFLDKHPTKKVLKGGKIKFKSAENEKSGIKKLRIASWVLLVASIISFLVLQACTTLLYNRNGIYTENLHLCFLFLPIPIATAIIGIILKIKGQKSTVHIVLGFIIAFMFLGFGLISIAEANIEANIYKNIYEEDNELIVMAEKYTDIDIPEYKTLRTHKVEGYNPESTSDNITYTISEVYFEQKKVEVFENQLPNNKNWLSEIPTNLIGMMSRHYTQFYNYLTYDYAMIYNMSSKEPNTLPSEEGKYQCLNIFYNINQNKMIIVEYQMRYRE